MMVRARGALERRGFAVVQGIIAITSQRRIATKRKGGAQVGEHLIWCHAQQMCSCT
jgi:hypothetical protein